MKDTMPNDSELTTIEPQVVEKPPRFYGKTQEAAKLILEHGVEPKQALLLTTGKIPDSGNLSRFKQKLQKYSLTQPSMVKLAHKAVQDTLAMKPIVTADGKEIHPSHTNRLAAAQMVADRVEPVVRVNQNMNINVEISPIDLEKYR